MTGHDRDIEKFDVGELLVSRVLQHGRLTATEQNELATLPFRLRKVEAGQDIVLQGDRPDHAVLVLKGMLARYHTLASGERQYLSLHIAGDMPDLQSLNLAIMDHSVCAMNDALIAMFPHGPLRELLRQRSTLCFAFWRLTLIDAAIFRQAITNNARTHVARLAHLFCEQFFRAKEYGLAEGNCCSLPLSQIQLGQALGMAQISVHRALQRLRRARLVELKQGTLCIHDWGGLVRAAGFDPLFLHVA